MNTEWTKPSTCSGDLGCIETRVTDLGYVAVRDSHDPDYRILFHPGEWREFVTAVKNGEYDLDET